MRSIKQIWKLKNNLEDYKNVFPFICMFLNANNSAASS